MCSMDAISFYVFFFIEFSTFKSRMIQKNRNRIVGQRGFSEPFNRAPCFRYLCRIRTITGGGEETRIIGEEKSSPLAEVLKRPIPLFVIVWSYKLIAMLLMKPPKQTFVCLLAVFIYITHHNRKNHINRILRMRML